jgi:hypothetical protein
MARGGGDGPLSRSATATVSMSAPRNSAAAFSLRSRSRHPSQTEKFRLPGWQTIGNAHTAPLCETRGIAKTPFSRSSLEVRNRITEHEFSQSEMETVMREISPQTCGILVRGRDAAAFRGLEEQGQRHHAKGQDRAHCEDIHVGENRCLRLQRPIDQPDSALMHRFRRKALRQAWYAPAGRRVG